MGEEQILPPPPECRETENKASLPSLDLSLSTEAEPMEEEEEEVKEVKEEEDPQNKLTPSVPGFFVPIPYPHLWPENNNNIKQQHQVLKPTPVLRKEAVNVDQLVGMSQLNLSETEKNTHPQLSLNLLGAPSRQSAFHVNVPVTSSDLNQGKNSAIQAISG